MTTTQLEKLLFVQGGKCFFCKAQLDKTQASVEHLVAKSNGGSNANNENCVACCKAINSLLGNLSIKQKIEIILNQKGDFSCPGKAVENTLQVKAVTAKVKSVKPVAVNKEQEQLKSIISVVLNNLKKRGNSRPKKLKTLISTISSIVELKGIKEPEINVVIEGLKKSGKISVKGEVVTYSL